MTLNNHLRTGSAKAGNFSIVARKMCLLLCFLPLFVSAEVHAADPYAPYQSSARPFGLDIVEKVSRWDADTASQNFHQTQVPLLRDVALKNLRESKAVSNAQVNLHAIDPSKIRLQTLSDVRCYFVGEGAGFHNTLGFNAGAGGITGGDPKLIFPDASTSVGESNLTGNGVRSQSAPLLPGDFVNLGRFNAGTQLNFFLGADAANGGKNVFSTQSSLNKDGLIHVVAYTVPDSPYLLIGFEDLYGGGDRDYNDLMFTIDIGRANTAYLSSPEPGTWMTMIALLTVGVLTGKRAISGARPASDG